MINTLLGLSGRFILVVFLGLSPVAADVAFDAANLSSQNDALKILRVTPNGLDVAAERQIVFQFDRDVVPVGRMDRTSDEIPIEISPALNCEWRWLNTRALACQLKQADAMKAATRYRIDVQPGIKTESGLGMLAAQRYAFTTQRPKVTYRRFVNWSQPGKPLVQVRFNQAVTQASVAKALTMRQQRTGAIYELDVYAHEVVRTLPHGVAAEAGLHPIKDDMARHIWVVTPKRHLPLDAEIVLHVTPGLISSEGPMAGIEDRAVVQFHTFPEFRFLGVRCYKPKAQHQQLITPEQMLGHEKTNNEADLAVARCLPEQRVALVFSAPVRNSMIRDYVDLIPRLDGGREDYDPWKNRRDHTYLGYQHHQGRDYRVWLPESLKAFEKYQLSFILDQLQDEFGRRLNAQPQYHFFTSHRDPRLVLNHNFAVLEKGLDTEVPVYVTNLEHVDVHYQSLTVKEKGTAQQHRLSLPKAEDVSFATPLHARDLITMDSGVAAGYLQPVPPTQDGRQHLEFFVQMTPYQVHVKLGHFSSLAWITDLTTGKPVPGVKVSLQKGHYHRLTQLQDEKVEASSDANGIARFAGFSQFDPLLTQLRRWYYQDAPRYFLHVEKDEDIALLPLDQHFQVRNTGIWPDLRKEHGHSHAWGTSAQGVYKLGDQVQYKIYLREQSNRHWVSPLKEQYHLKVYDPQRKLVHEQTQVTLSQFGALDGEFKLPEQGAVGWYQFELTANYSDQPWRPLRVLVSDFTPSPFKVSAELNGEHFKAGDKLTINTHAAMHSGGPFTHAPVRLTARVQAQPYRPQNAYTKGFVFGGGSQDYSYRNPMRLLDLNNQLDQTGEFSTSIELPQKDIYYGEITVEAAVRDDRGKYVASTVNAKYAGRDRYVGLRNTKWLYETDKNAVVEALVVDDQHQLVAGTDVEINIQRRENKVSRVKGPGNAYLTQNVMTWVDVAQCEFKSQKDVSECEFVPEASGSYQIIATIKDQQGRAHQTTLHAWVTGRGYVAWDVSNDNDLQLLAEQDDFQVGDRARYLVKNPFPGAYALVTIERYGVIDAWVEKLEGSTPVVEFEIKEDYIPGFYLSVVVFSPRVEQPLGDNQVDLGKPSYRMGYATAKVNDVHKMLDVQVATEKARYKPRDVIKVAIQVKPKVEGKTEPVEIAVAVIDESVLALNRAGRGYYDPYQGFNKLDPLDVNNYSLISRLVGRQKFEKKGANSGGDGGAPVATLRDQFRFISYWNPAITPDEDGKAEISFTAPDNLTGWRILAWAVTPEARMGLGETSYKVNRETELRPVMPNQLIEGDQFSAGFSVMNRSERERKLNVRIEVDGLLVEGESKQHLQQLTLPAYTRANVWWPLTTDGPGELRFVVEAGDEYDVDKFEHRVSVNRRRSLETAATYGTTTQAQVSESFHIPEAIYTDVGGIRVALSPSVIGNIDGAFKYIKTYPHLCWEQRLTKAVMASSYLQLEDYLNENFVWEEAQATTEQQLAAAANFQAPNGGMAYWVASNRHVSPYLSAYTALAFNWLRRDGYAIPQAVESKLHDYLLSLLRKDVFPSFYSQGMASSVRAVALAALAEHDKVNRDDIARYQTYVGEMDLFGRAHFLQAALQTGFSEHVVETVSDDILAHAVQSGGKFQFNEAWDERYKYFLATPLRSNCAILSGLMKAQRNVRVASKIADIPFKLVRSITQTRGNRDHWENTQENVFCLNALIDYSNLYEAQDPDFDIKVSFDGKIMGHTRFNKISDAPVEIERPMESDDAGKRTELVIDKQGQGRVYYAAYLDYELREDHRSRVNAGIEVRREYNVEREGVWLKLESPMQVKRGELVRIDLFVSIPTARHYVVLNDPVPGGLEPVNVDLATNSTVDAEKGRFKASEGSWWFQFDDWRHYGRYFWSFYHKELRHDAARFYADYLPAGNYHLSYTAQAIATGEFSVMPAKAEEMYDADVYGLGLPMKLRVEESQ